ncbi:2-dehydro-3-deoxygluconate kinase (plasmid) [Marinovum algicola DG 898]|nr:2-dehydro-3-deoxygluconate kinase [Marinovum algicola DG 898]
MTRSICVIGNLNVDLVMGTLAHWPEPGTETFLDRCDLRPGGSAANTALALQRLEHPAGLISAIGSDPLADILAARFSGRLDRIRRLDGQTGISFGVLHDGAERSFLSFGGHLAALDLAMVEALLEGWPLEDALVLVAGGFATPGLAAEGKALLTWLRRAGAGIAIDPGWPDGGWTPATRAQVMGWAALSDHLLLNDKELTALAARPEDDLAAAARSLSDGLPERCHIIAKRGPRGASCWQGSRVCHASAPPTAPFDTVGAGDAFNAGYLAAIAEGAAPEAALGRGCATASRLIAEFPRGTGPLADRSA